MSLIGETVVSKHYNDRQSIPLEHRRTSPILQLRNFNNWLKAVLIAKFMATTRDVFPDEVDSMAVLDLACGKGGDLQKWAKHEVAHVVFVDLAKNSVDECSSRYKNYRKKRYRLPCFKAYFYVLDCAKDSLLEQVASSTNNESLWPFEFHLTSCQFSFHYSFETPARADQMFKNAVQCLKPGGYFIGTIPNANRIMKRLRESSSSEFGNSAYKITFPENFDKNAVPPLFGCEYYFYLSGAVSCPEFLVHWPLFKYLAERNGMELIFVMNFDIFLRRYQTDKGAVDLLDRMRGIVSLRAPPAPDSTSDMDHIDNYLNSLSEEKRQSVWPIGTLPKSQWDVATLYLAFALKRRK